MSKQIIRLTESDLHRLVKKSVKRIIKESTDSERVNQLISSAKQSIDELLAIYTSGDLDVETYNQITMFLGGVIDGIDSATDELDDDLYFDDEEGLSDDDDELSFYDNSQYVN